MGRPTSRDAVIIRFHRFRDREGARLAPDFRPHGREHDQSPLQEHGLTGSFWRLPC